MAKVKAPFLSVRARKSIGGSITYQPWKGIQTAREIPIPTGIPSSSQVLLRSMYSKLSYIWRSNIYTQADIDAFNLWIKTFRPGISIWNLQVVNLVPHYTEDPTAFALFMISYSLFPTFYRFTVFHQPTPVPDIRMYVSENHPYAFSLFDTQSDNWWWSEFDYPRHTTDDKLIYIYWDVINANCRGKSGLHYETIAHQ